MASETRQRMIQSAALLMRERGVEATSFSDVISHSGAPRGSIYHHFPDGKAELIEEATRYAGEYIAAGLMAALAKDDPAAAVSAFASRWSKALRSSDFAAGCPVVAATLEGERTPRAREMAGAVFARWEELLAGAIEEHGLCPERAKALATLAIAAIEGAIVLARAQRSSAPLECVSEELGRVIAEGVG